MAKNNMISILGSGSVGFSVAYLMSRIGLNVILWNRPNDRIEKILYDNRFGVKDIDGRNYEARIVRSTVDINDAVNGGDVVFIATPAYAHREIFENIRVQNLSDKVFVLMPGRTFGCLEAYRYLNDYDTTILEMQTVPYACRIIDNKLELMGGKKILYISSPKTVHKNIQTKLNELIPALKFCDNYLDVTINNIGALLHPVATVLNSARIQSENRFMFYSEGMSPVVTNYIEAIDAEKERLCRVLKCRYMSVKEWVENEYLNCKTDNLLQALNMVDAYKKVLAPRTLEHRYIYDDIKTGLVPLYILGKECGLNMSKTEAFINFSSCLLDHDFIAEGRNITKKDLLKWHLFQ